MWSVRETVTSPVCWVASLGPTRVQRQRKALSDCAPPGGSPAAGSARPHFLRSRGRPAAIRAVLLSAGRGTSAVSADERQHLHAGASEVLPAGFEDSLGCFASERPRHGPAATRVKTARGYQVLPEPVGPQLAHSLAVHDLGSPAVGFSW